MTFWIVAGVLLVALLAAMALMDRRARARGARVRGDMAGGNQGAAGRTTSEAMGDARVHNSQRRSGNGI